MINFLLFTLIVYESYSSQLKYNHHSPLTLSPNLFFSDNNNNKNSISMKTKNDFICTSSTEILEELFTDSANIKSDEGCQSITIIKCRFESIMIPEDLQSESALSIVHIKNTELYIDNSNFQNCISISKTSDSYICHIIYVEENIDHDVYIHNCSFNNNGYESSPYGTIILLKNSNNVQISFTKFQSDQKFASAIQAIYTNNINLSYNTFTKMIESVSIQFSINVSINSCTFDLNKVKPSDSSQIENDKLHASALFVNLNESFSFSNNTIMNHETDLNMMVTFNNNVSLSSQNSEGIQNLKTVLIEDSKFINNKYSKSFDGSGIGFNIDFESIENSNFLNIVFDGCVFSGNGDSTNNELENAAGVFGWSKNRSFLSFINCNFELNHSPSSSSLINVQNGCDLIIENCTITGVIDYSFLKYSPLIPSEENQFNQEISIQITNFSIENTDSKNIINNDFILIESSSESTNTLLIIDNCTFTDISLNSNNFLIHSKSNLNSIQIENSSFKFNEHQKGSNILKLETANVNFLTLNECNFDKCLFAVSSEITVEKTVISNCIFTDCISEKVISIKSELFECKNSEILFTSHENDACSMGIFISESISASITNTNFKNCLGIQDGCAIQCLSQNSNETMITVNSCTFEECTPNKANVYTTNRAVNFVNNTITTKSSDDKLNGLFVNYMCQLFIDDCTFTRCSYSSTNGSSIKYIPTNYDADVIESINIQNCIFTECSGYASVASIYPVFTHPKFINLTIENSKHNFNFIIEMLPFSPIKEDSGEVLLQNVSFLNTNPNGNVAVGGGGCGFLYKTTISDDDRVSFIDCHFENTFYQQAASNGYGGGAICIQSNSCWNFHIQISSCSFVNCYTKSQTGGAIAITTMKSIQIDNCYFENCKIDSDLFHDLKGGAIYVNKNSEQQQQPFSLINVTFNETLSSSDFSAVDFECTDCSLYSIENCNFINCKTRSYEKLSYNIISCPKTVQQFECINTNFIFDEKSTMNPRAAQLGSPSFSFNNCTFLRCGSKYINQGGALLYDGTEMQERISIENCCFDECDAMNSGVFKIIFNSAAVPILTNITVQRTKSDYTIFIDYKMNVRSAIQFNRVKFIDNYNSLDGGGSGVWTTNYQDEWSTYSVYIYFYCCEFINNFSPNNGGGYGIGYDEKIKPTHLTFYFCEFIGNHCEGSDGGGALWIRTSSSCSITQCIFKDNYASESIASNGGALYLSFTTNMIFMTISQCTFVNNSCPHFNSRGHAVYSTLLYGRMEISYTNLTDNGIGCEYPNAVVYTRSEIRIISSSIINTNKENVYSRAIYVGASSDLTMRNNLIANCSVVSESGAAVYYESIKSKGGASIDIIDNTFINNTGDGRGTGIYLHISSSLRLYNCTFIDVNATQDIILVRYENALSYSTIYDRFIFINCHFNYNHFISRIPDDDEVMDEKNLYMSSCRYSSCSNIPFIFSNCYAVEIKNCVFENNINDNSFFAINTVTSNALISDCIFKNNRVKNTENNDLAFIKMSRVRMTIINTKFENDDIVCEENDQLKSSMIQTDCKLNLTNVSFNNCSSFNCSINFTPKLESYYFVYDTFCIINSVVNNSGSVLLNDWTEQIVVINTSFINSLNGLIYTTKSSYPNGFVSDVFQFENNVFDKLTNCACSLIVMNDINIENITIKNCKSIDDENCPPIFELDIRNKSINFFTLDHFTFENNEFNNNDNKRWMNGGGTGFVLELSYLKDENEIDKEVSLDFVDCFFISNNAENNGGGFCFIESNETTTFISFDNCHFKGNTCNKNEGSALYLDVKNVSFNNCIFESNSKSKSVEDENKNSAVYLHFVTEDDDPESFIIDNCSFIDNKEHSIHIHNCSKKLSILNCNFLNNQKHSLLIDNCKKDIMILNTTFSNNQEDALYITKCDTKLNILNCLFENNSMFVNAFNLDIFIKNSTFSDNEDNNSIAVYDSNSNLTISSCSFTNNLKYSIFLSNCDSYSNIMNCIFSNNRENPLNFIESEGVKCTLLHCLFMNNSNYSLHASNFVNLLFIQNCSFTEKSFYVSNCIDLITVTNCSFSNCIEKSIYIDSCKNDVFISDCSFVSVREENFIFIKTNSSFIMENVYIKGNETNKDYAISCYCTKSLIIENTTIMNSGGICVLKGASISDHITLKNVNIKESNYGFYYFNDDEDDSNVSININECTFSSIKHALLLSLTNNNFQLKNNTICDCFNLDENEEKMSIIFIKINSFEPLINLIFDEFVFKNNKYLQPKKQTTGFGGGIGLSISTTKEKEQSFKLAFNNCIFTSNEATDMKHNNNKNENLSGGALYYATNESIKMSSLSFTNCNFTKNYAQGKGGSLFIHTDYNCPLKINNCWFEVNQAEIDGAAVYVKNKADFTIDSCNFINNSVSLNSEPSSSSSLLIPTDSLVVCACGNVFVDNSLFIKLLFPGEESSVQTMFSIENQNPGKEVSIVVKDSVYSIINPTKSVVALRSQKMNGKINIINVSFTHFYILNESKLATQTGTASPTETFPPTETETETETTTSSQEQESKSETETETNELLTSSSSSDFNFDFDSSVLLSKSSKSSVVSRSNESIKNYVHIYIKSDLIGTVNIQNSCFDTDEVYSSNGDQIGLKTDQSDSVINQAAVSVTESKIGSIKCNHPSIIDDLIDKNFASTPVTPRIRSTNNNKKKLIIGLVVGLVGLALIVSVVLVICFVQRKKKRELEEKLRIEAEKEKEMSVELDIVTNKLGYPTQAITQENPLFIYANLTNLDNNEFEENHEKVMVTKDCQV